MHVFIRVRVCSSTSCASCQATTCTLISHTHTHTRTLTCTHTRVCTQMCSRSCRILWPSSPWSATSCAQSCRWPRLLPKMHLKAGKGAEVAETLLMLQACACVRVRVHVCGCAVGGWVNACTHKLQNTKGRESRLCSVLLAWVCVHACICFFCVVGGDITCFAKDVGSTAENVVHHFPENHYSLWN